MENQFSMEMGKMLRSHFWAWVTKQNMTHLLLPNMFSLLGRCVTKLNQEYEHGDGLLYTVFGKFIFLVAFSLAKGISSN